MHTGTTGDGRCNRGECDMGDKNSETNMHSLVIKIERAPKEGFAGEGAAKRNNAMSQMRIEEFPKHAMERTPEKTVAVDLCAGWQNKRPAHGKPGLECAAADIECGRNIRRLIRPSATGGPDKKMPPDEKGWGDTPEWKETEP